MGKKRRKRLERRPQFRASAEESGGFFDRMEIPQNREKMLPAVSQPYFDHGEHVCALGEGCRDTFWKFSADPDFWSFF